MTPPAARLLALLVLAVTAAAYAALLLAGFVWDDLPLVVHNDLTGDPARLGELFTTDLWRSSRTASVDSGYYRPMMLLSLALDRALWGLSPAGHHAQSLLWHLGACAALHALLRQLLPPAGALAGVALFALHPVQSEAVAWIAARNDLMVACTGFLALAALAPAQVSGARAAAGGALALAAALSKETGVLLPGALALLDLARFGRPVGGRRYLALGLAVAAWAGLRASVGIVPAATPDAAQLGFLAERAPQLVAWLAGRLLWPHPLTTGASIEYHEPEPLAWIGPPLAGALACALALRRGGRLAGAGLALAALAFAPSLGAIALRGQLGERYLYLPMGGLALALGAALPATRLTLALALGAALASLGVLHRRLPEWQSDLSLQSAALRDAPSPTTHASLAHILHGEGRLAEAAAHYHEALRGPRPSHDACDYAVLLPLKLQDPALAARGWGLAEAARCPRSAALLGHAAMTAAWLGRWDEARGLVHEALASGAPLTPRLAIAGGALARREGDAEGFARMFAAQTADLAAFERLVDDLLAAAPPG